MTWTRTESTLIANNKEILQDVTSFYTRSDHRLFKAKIAFKLKNKQDNLEIKIPVTQNQGLDITFDCVQHSSMLRALRECSTDHRYFAETPKILLKGTITWFAISHKLLTPLLQSAMKSNNWGNIEDNICGEYLNTWGFRITKSRTGNWSHLTSSWAIYPIAIHEF